MNELKVSNKFFVTAIADGASISTTLYTTGSLAQAWNKEAGVCIPDWTNPDNQPIVYGIARVKGQQKRLNSAPVWKYNEHIITFDETTKISTGDFEGLFQRIDNYTIEGSDVICPAMKIINNLADSGNVDNDVISLSGSVEVGGANLDFSVNIPVRITEMSSTGFYGYVSGDAIISTPTDIAEMHAHLFNGVDRVGVASYTTKWYREGIDTEDNPFAIVRATDPHPEGAIAHTVSLSASQVLDNNVIRVDFYDVTNTLVYKAFWNIDDTQDAEEMYITHGTNNQNNAALRENQHVTFRIWMGRRTDTSYIDTRFHTFQVRITDSNSDIVPIVVDALNDNTIVKDTESGTTFADITKSGEHTGLATITYDFAVDQGDTITGLVVATGSTFNN